jgi:hypothetical protein
MDVFFSQHIIRNMMKHCCFKWVFPVDHASIPLEGNRKKNKAATNWAFETSSDRNTLWQFFWQWQGKTSILVDKDRL